MPRAHEGLGKDTSPLSPHSNGPSEWSPGRGDTSPSRPPAGKCSQTAEGGAAGPVGPRARSSTRKTARGVGEPDPGTQARGAERWGAGRAPGEPPPAAAPPARGAEIRPGPTRTECVAARRGPRAGAARGAAAALVERSEDGPARGPAQEGHTRQEELALQGSVQRAKQGQLGGAGVLAWSTANRAKIKGARSSKHSSQLHT